MEEDYKLKIDLVIELLKKKKPTITLLSSCQPSRGCFTSG
jgi:hypothetical protein